MAKKYLSTKTRIRHTYAFYKKRKNAPLWKGDYLRIKAIRQRNIVFGFLIICMIAVGVSFYLIENNNKNIANRPINEVKRDKNKVQKVRSTGKENTTHYSEQPVQDPKVAVREFLAKGFSIVPIFYNGQNVNDAMNEGNAPQNLVHDSFTIGYLKDNTTVRIKSMATAIDENILVFNNSIELNEMKFEYTVSSSGKIQFKNYEGSYNGTTVTYQISSEPDAKSMVDEAPTQN